jgi:predicted phage terminase large subunit-like protein
MADNPFHTMPKARNHTERIIKDIMRRGMSKPGAMNDLFDLIRQLQIDGAVLVDGEPVFDKENFRDAAIFNSELRRLAAEKIRKNGDPDMVELYKRSLLLDAKYNFDCYCRYLEWNRPAKKKFYEPRRKQLKPIADAMQQLADGELDLLAVSLPPGTGKTTLSIFFLSWIGGKNPELSVLGGSHSNSLLHGIFDELLRVLDKDGEYLYNDVFPLAPVVGNSGKELRIDLQTQKRFETFEFSSIGSGNAGKVRCSRLLYCDDLIDGIETAMSRDRLDKLWQQYYTDLRQRKIGNCAELHVATRWSIWDPIGRLQQEYDGDKRAKFLVFPAMNDRDESNFDYPYSLGFTTQMYRQQREIMDDASWRALYQNIPVEREGRVYDPEELRYYFSLPDVEPDSIVAICDTKEQGDDYCAMPVFYQYGQDYYLDAWICDNGKVEVVMEKVVRMLVDRKVKVCRIESNRGGTLFAADVQKRLRELNGITTITTKWTQTNKSVRIQTNAGWVKSHVLFRDTTVQNKEYRLAMNQLVEYTMSGRVKHDDVPDVLAMFVDMVVSSDMNTAVVMHRPF